MGQRKSFFHRLTGWLLLLALAVGVLGGAGLSARAAPDAKPLAVCPDPTIAKWTFTGAVAPAIPPPSTGAGTLVAGSGITGPDYNAGQNSSETPAISFTGWDSPSMDPNDYLEFQLDTSGISSITLDFKYRISGTGPTGLEIQYSTDGTTFSTFGSPTTLSNGTSWHALNFPLSSISALNNNPNVRIRLYGYGGAATGTWRLDNITFTGTCPAPSGSVLISEVAWAGTAANTDHEWIELYNPGSTAINFYDGVNHWTLESLDGSFYVELTGTIPATGYYLLETHEDAVANILANQLYTGSKTTLRNSGMRLVLYDNLVANHTVVDTANADGGAWPAGSASKNATMERIGALPDSDSAWFTNNGVMKNGIDAGGNPIWGTPKGLNSLTPTPIPPPTPLPTPASKLDIVISEVAWAGTGASSDDEWLELYNPGKKDIDLTGWKLSSSDGSPVIDDEFKNITLKVGEYLLLERTDDDTVATLPDDFTCESIIYAGSLNNTGEVLRLYDSRGTLVDTANSNGSYWPAGSSSNYASMERSVIENDSDFTWVTYDASKDNKARFAKDADGDPIKGTPCRRSVPFNVTPTPTPQRTSTPQSGSSGSVQPILVLSEFLPRPGYDWNNDGQVDVFDEFIEVINAGPINVNLSSYRLDDEEDQGSAPYTLPSLTLKPGERAVFYASETGIMLSDAGDTVRLLRSNKVEDAYTYDFARYPDQSWCRILDSYGDWVTPCFPTPNNPNALTGNLPLPPGPSGGYRAPVCPLPDTAPDEFVYAECETTGGGIWNRQFWDGNRFFQWLMPTLAQKWVTFFE